MLIVSFGNKGETTLFCSEFFPDEKITHEVLQQISFVGSSSNIKKRAEEAFPLVIKTLNASHVSSLLEIVRSTPQETVVVFSTALSTEIYES